MTSHIAENVTSKKQETLDSKSKFIKGDSASNIESFVLPIDISGKTIAGIAAGITILSACSSGSGSSGTPVPVNNADASRLLLQSQLSASDAEVSAVVSQGYSLWLDAQFNAPSSMSGWDWLDSRGYNTIDSTNQYYNATYPGDYMIWSQLMTSSDAVRKRIAIALSEYFVISLSGLAMTWPSFAIAAWWDMLVSDALGTFRQLLEDVTLNAGMGFYLSSRGSQKENLVTGRQPDENYAREVMQLFTIGLYQLNLDGTPKLDANGKMIETYTLNDVTNLAHVFTGYDWDHSQDSPTTLGSASIISPNYTRLPMVLNPSLHSTLEVTFLGTTIPANTDGKTALKMALDTLFNHPNVGPFFGRQMIQRLVTSNPSPEYVARVAAIFNNSNGVRGDLKSVFKAILLDDEARNPDYANQPFFGKLREPMLRLVQWGRTFGISSADNSWKIGDVSDTATRLGQSPLRSPSVFNFFRPGYVPPSTILAASQKVAPEFQIVNEPTVSSYLNFMQGVIRNGFAGGNASAIAASYTNELPLAMGDATDLVQRINLLLCAGQLSAATVTLIVNAVNTMPLPTSTNTGALDRVCAAVFLVMASSEYLVQK